MYIYIEDTWFYLKCTYIGVNLGIIPRFTSLAASRERLMVPINILNNIPAVTLGNATKVSITQKTVSGSKHATHVTDLEEKALLIPPPAREKYRPDPKCHIYSPTVLVCSCLLGLLGHGVLSFYSSEWCSWVPSVLFLAEPIMKQTRQQAWTQNSLRLFTKSSHNWWICREQVKVTVWYTKCSISNMLQHK